MRLFDRKLARLLAAMFVACLFFVAPALAQEDEELAWYDVPALPEASPWLQWVLGAVFAIAILLTAFKNPHRTHLD